MVALTAGHRYGLRACGPNAVRPSRDRGNRLVVERSCRGDAGGLPPVVDSEAEEHRSDGDAQHRDAVGNELVMEDVLQLEEAIVEAAHTGLVRRMADPGSLSALGMTRLDD